MKKEDAVLLQNHNAVIYGGGGAIGGAVARVFAREGARVFLAGRTKARLDAVAADIAARAERSRPRRLTLSINGRSRSMPTRLRSGIRRTVPAR
jgi:NAD(P)-dependent dehydrogenase (short-subunit alcohol dehydrogenase family)